VRVIAATNRNLGDAVRAGTFREDLLYRLSVMDVELPPLREREGDVPLLANFFVSRFNQELRTSVTSISTEAIAKLQAHSWPGNVRELRNTLERAMLLFDAEVLEPEHLRMAQPVRDINRRYELPPDGVDLLEVERDLVTTALVRTRGNQSRAAALLRITRDQIRHRMLKFNLGRPQAE
jgi:DNA-binding NtrC family response regulator